MFAVSLKKMKKNEKAYRPKLGTICCCREKVFKESYKDMNGSYSVRLMSDF